MSMYDDEDEAEFEKTSVVPSDTFKVRLAQAGQAPPCLVLLVGPSQEVGRQWPIEDTERSLGRAPQNNICVVEKSVSSGHAKLLLSAGDVSVVDLQSTNKTMVNGKVIEPMVPTKLRNNDKLQIGNVIFKFLEKGNIETVSTAESYDRGMTDALTGINNKGAFEKKADEFFKRSNLLNAELSLITFDIDHFKAVNDTYGHATGDYVLKELSKEIRDHLIRGNDFFARTGGEEFCILLLGGPSKQAQEIAERIRKTIENKKFEMNGIEIPITISLGVSTKLASDKDWQSLFGRADKALYTSKNGGRNCATAA